MASLDDDESKICRVCTREFAKYSCPRCNIMYCSLVCYKEHGETCTDSFYQDQVKTEMKSKRASAEQQKEMRQTLQRVHQYQTEQTETINKHGDETEYTDRQAVNGYDGEEENARGPGEGDGDEALALAGMGIDPNILQQLQTLALNDKLSLEDLPASLQADFMKAIQDGRMGKIMHNHAWRAWWEPPALAAASSSSPAHTEGDSEGLEGADDNPIKSDNNGRDPRDSDSDGNGDGDGNSDIVLAASASNATFNRAPRRPALGITMTDDQDDDDNGRSDSSSQRITTCAIDRTDNDVDGKKQIHQRNNPSSDGSADCNTYSEWPHTDASMPSDTPSLPPTPLPSLHALSAHPPSPLIANDIVDVLYAYAYTLRLYNGDTSDVGEWVDVMLSLTPVFDSKNKIKTKNKNKNKKNKHKNKRERKKEKSIIQIKSSPSKSSAASTPPSSSSSSSSSSPSSSSSSSSPSSSSSSSSLSPSSSSSSLSSVRTPHASLSMAVTSCLSHSIKPSVKTSLSFSISVLRDVSQLLFYKSLTLRALQHLQTLLDTYRLQLTGSHPASSSAPLSASATSSSPCSKLTANSNATDKTNNPTLTNADTHTHTKTHAKTRAEASSGTRMHTESDTQSRPKKALTLLEKAQRRSRHRAAKLKLAGHKLRYFMAYAYNTPHDPSVIRRELQVLKERRGRAAGRHVPEIVLQKVLGDSCGDAETGSEASASGASVSSLYALASRVEELWRRERRQHEVNTERNEQLKNERRQGSFNTCRSSASSSAGRGVAGDDNGDDVITVKPRRYARAQPCHSLSNNNSRGSIANDQGNDGNGIKVPTRPRSVARERQAAGDLGDLFNVNTDGLGSFKY